MKRHISAVNTVWRSKIHAAEDAPFDTQFDVPIVIDDAAQDFIVARSSQLSFSHKVVQNYLNESWCNHNMP